MTLVLGTTSTRWIFILRERRLNWAAGAAVVGEVTNSLRVLWVGGGIAAGSFSWLW